MLLVRRIIFCDRLYRYNSYVINIVVHILFTWYLGMVDEVIELDKPWVVPSEFYSVVNEREKIVKCLVCERGCVLKPGEKGFCWNHVNVGGRLYSVGYGLLSAVESRPIEIKPLFHYYPNSTALTFSGYGCNFQCPWCQNYLLSSVPPSPDRALYIAPRELVREAVRRGDDGLCASFNEPTIHLEYLLDLAEEARGYNLYYTMVTNGYMTRNSIKRLVEEGVDGYSIDLKGCPEMYRSILGADPLVVLRNARYIVDNGGHVEIVFLIVTGANDSRECIEWVIEKHYEVLGEDIPLHINRYYPAHKYREPPTSMDKLFMAYKIAKEIGINYVYIGNIGDESYQDTVCPKCNKVVVRRRGYRVVEWLLDSGNRCPRCGFKIPFKGRYIPGKQLPLII